MKRFFVFCAALACLISIGLTGFIVWAIFKVVVHVTGG